MKRCGHRWEEHKTETRVVVHVCDVTTPHGVHECRCGQTGVPFVDPDDKED